MYKCEKCGREFKRESNLTWHEKACDGIYKKPHSHNAVMHKSPIKKPIIKNEKVECIKSATGEHDIVFLNKNIPNQANAIAMGYSAFCRICKELV